LDKTYKRLLVLKYTTTIITTLYNGVPVVESKIDRSQLALVPTLKSRLKGIFYCIGYINWQSMYYM